MSEAAVVECQRKVWVVVPGVRVDLDRVAF